VGRAAITHSDVADSMAGRRERSRKISLLLHFPQGEMLGTQPYGFKRLQEIGAEKRGEREREREREEA